MATYKESNIDKDKFCDLIYDQSVFDIPRLLDFCAIYGSNNMPLVRKMLSSLYQVQPKYYNDTTIMVKALFDLFSAVEQKLGIEKLDCARKLSDQIERKSVQSAKEFEDLVSYVCDISYTLLLFLDCAPFTSSIFYAENFPQKLSEFYENFTLNIYTNLTKYSSNTDIMVKLKNAVDSTRINLLFIYNTIISEAIVVKLRNNKETDSLLDNYIDSWLSIMSQTRFIADYERLFPFNADINYIIQHIPSVDINRFDYIIEAIESACEVYPVQSVSGAEGGSVASEVDSHSDLIQILELFPHLDSEYVCQCLIDSNNDTQRVINDLLENPNNCSASVAANSRNTRKEDISHASTSSILSTRLNIFDGDKFDIFKSDSIDIASIHKGKQEKSNKDTDKLLNQQLKPLYDKYANEFHYGSAYDKDFEYDENNLYEDEYDDTYDTLGTEGDLDVDSAEELMSHDFKYLKSSQNGGYSDVIKKSGNPFNGRKNENLNSFASTKGSDYVAQRTDKFDINTSSNSSALSAKNPNNFLEDPEELRRIREEKRQAQRPCKSVYYSSQGNGASNKDVVGAQKGMGQTEEVLKNRNYKEKNKAMRVNHNRKNLADKKRHI